MNKKQQLQQRFREVEARGKALMEAIGDNPMTNEQRSELGKINGELENIQRELDEILEEERARGGDEAELKRFRDLQSRAEEPEDPLAPEQQRQQRAAPAQQERGPRFNGTIGDYLRYVIQSERRNGAVEERLTRAATGMSIGIDSEGGFLIPETQVNELAGIISSTSQIRQRVRERPITNGNTLKVNVIDETSRATGSRFGGIQVYTAAEAGTVAGTKPKFRQVRLEVEKVMGLAYLTEELIADGPALESEVRGMFAEEFAWQIDNYILNGSGAGQPLGILNSPARVAIAAETNQPSGTIKWENISKMWDRLLPMDKAQAVWLANQNTGHQLRNMHKVVGTGGIPVYLPANGAASTPFATLMGRPVIEVEQCPTVGTEGDIMLASLRHYWFAQKGGMTSAVSIHVKFVEGESALRFTIRIDGKPWMKQPLTPANGTDTLSPFITIATR